MWNRSRQLLRKCIPDRRKRWGRSHLYLWTWGLTPAPAPLTEPPCVEAEGEEEWPAGLSGTQPPSPLWRPPAKVASPPSEIKDLNQLCAAKRCWPITDWLFLRFQIRCFPLKILLVTNLNLVHQNGNVSGHHLAQLSYLNSQLWGH